MQSIERYGIVALLFLVATFTAVFVMDGDPPSTDPAVARAARKTPSKPRAALRSDGRNDAAREQPAVAETPRLKMQLAASPIRKRGLARDGFSVSRAAELELELERAERRAREQRLLEVENPRAAPRAGFAPRIATPMEREPARQDTREDPRAALTAADTPRPNSTQPRAAATYVVRSGDTLGEISQSRLGTFKLWRRIVAANPGLDPAKLRVGQVLRMPEEADEGAGPVVPTAPTATTTPKPASGRYTLRSGDSLWKIAERMLGDGNRYREIIAMNPGINPNRVKVGQKIKLPAAAARSAPGPRASAPIASRSSSPTATRTRTAGRVR